jgi:hypothetical protein
VCFLHIEQPNLLPLLLLYLLVVLLLQVAGYGTHNTYLRSPEQTVRVTPDQIVESVDASLKRLGTDYIDLLQVRLTLRPWPTSDR